MTTNRTAFLTLLLVAAMSPCVCKCIAREESSKAASGKRVDEYLSLNATQIREQMETSSYSRLSATNFQEHLFTLLYGGAKVPFMVLRFDESGTNLWAAGKVILKDGQYRDSPRIFPDAKGGLIVAWQQTAPDGVFALRLDSKGNTVWSRKMLPGKVFYYDMDVGEQGDIFVVTASTNFVLASQCNERGEVIWAFPTIVSAKGSILRRSAYVHIMDQCTLLVVWIAESKNDFSFYGQVLDAGTGVVEWKDPIRLGPAPHISYVAKLPRPKVTQSGNEYTVKLFKGRMGDAGTRIEEYDVRLPHRTRSFSSQTISNLSPEGVGSTNATEIP